MLIWLQCNYLVTNIDFYYYCYIYLSFLIYSQSFNDESFQHGSSFWKQEEDGGTSHPTQTFPGVQVPECQPFFFFFFFLIKHFFNVVQLQLSAFSPHPSISPQPNPPPSPASTLHLGFVHVSFIVVPVIPSSHCPPRPQAIVRLFLTSMSLVIFCLLFLLLIMFQLKVRSYGICPSPPGLFHLA